MNNLQLNLNLLSNKFYEFFWRSPSLFVNRIEQRLGRVGWKPRLVAPAETDAMSWVREDADFHTRLYVFNYWTDHYGIKEEMPLNLEVRNSMGQLIAADHLVLAPREMRVIEVGEVLQAKGIRSPFLGSLVLRRAVLGPGYGVPLKLLQEYYGQRFLSCVHEYSTVANFGYHEYQVGVSLWGAEDVEDIEIAALSCNVENQTKPAPMTMELLNHEGRKVRIHRRPLGPAQAVR